VRTTNNLKFGYCIITYYFHSEKKPQKEKNRFSAAAERRILSPVLKEFCKACPQSSSASPNLQTVCLLTSCKIDIEQIDRHADLFAGAARIS
jgi:hypothetical protein